MKVEVFITMSDGKIRMETPMPFPVKQIRDGVVIRVPTGAGGDWIIQVTKDKTKILYEG